MLSSNHYERVEAHADHLAENAETLGEWLAPRRRIVLLTVFRKTRRREPDEVDRAKPAQKACEAGHEVADTVWTR